MSALPTSAIAGPQPADEAFVEHSLRPYLAELLAEERAAWKQEGAPWDDPIGSLEGFLGGGKGLRPRFCYWGYQAAGPSGRDDRLLAAAAALELLHAFALIHDDLMDGSATRRGRPALHRCLADEHRRHGWAGDADQYGLAAALLTGDLAFALANRLSSGLAPAAQVVWHRLVAELTCGQHLDLVGGARGDRSPALARVIARLKSGRYTVTGPLQLGATVDAGGRPVDPAVLRFGDLVGEAFQWRDDLLGLFGDPAATGKPVGDDLRSGKPTLLLAVARHRATGADRAALDRVGDLGLTDAEVAQLTAIIERGGARQWLERRVERNLRRAGSLLCSADLPDPVRRALMALADQAAQRDA